MKTYAIKEIFYSIQGEGARAGEASVFVRFAGCNMQCSRQGPEGFDCDTDFKGGKHMSVEQILDAMDEHSQRAAWCILTGGEPGLQVNTSLVDQLHHAGWQVAVESNGSCELPANIDYVALSPKYQHQPIRAKRADEIRYVLPYGHGLPKFHTLMPSLLYVSPVFNGDTVDEDSLRWCIETVKNNPHVRLSFQQHKVWGVR